MRKVCKTPKEESLQGTPRGTFGGHRMRNVWRTPHEESLKDTLRGKFIGHPKLKHVGHPRQRFVGHPKRKDCRTPQEESLKDTHEECLQATPRQKVVGNPGRKLDEPQCWKAKKQIQYVSYPLTEGKCARAVGVISAECHLIRVQREAHSTNCFLIIFQ